MWRSGAVFSLAGALTLACVGAQAQSDHPAAPAAPPPAAPPSAPLPAGVSTPRVNLTDPVLAFYPAAAKAAGVEGQAVIRCRRDEHLALVGCTLVSENPPGQGFGAAALAMAAKSPQNPRLLLKDAAAEPSADTTIQFTLRPPYVTPDITRMAHIMKSASIVTQPTNAQIQAEYPPRALDNQVQGGAVIECVVTLTGKLAECQVYDEQPTGYGFGQAALDLAGDFLLKPRLIDGEAVGGSPVKIGVNFSSQAADAPLTLGGAKPADDQDQAGDRGAPPDPRITSH
jgi:Gram-negative bacterial TonB protein C-terminal